MSLTSTDIAKRLGTAKTPDEAIACVNLIPLRRAVLRARTAVLLPQLDGSAIHESDERKAALAQGLDGLKRLDDELAAIYREEDHLAHLERTGHEKSESLRIDSLRANYSPAIRALPKQIAETRRILAMLDEQLARLNATAQSVGAFADLHEPFPLRDDELNELYAIRDEIWQTRTVSVVTLPGHFDRKKEYPKSWARRFVTRGLAPDGEPLAVIERPPPRQIVITDYVNAEPRN